MAVLIYYYKKEKYFYEIRIAGTINLMNDEKRKILMTMKSSEKPIKY